MLFLQLTTPLSLFSLNLFALHRWQHLLVLDPQFPALEIQVVHLQDNSRCLLGGRKICKRQASENAVVEMVIERIREGESHFCHYRNELLFLDSEGDVLDDDGSGDELVLVPRGRNSRLLVSILAIVLLLVIYALNRHRRVVYPRLSSKKLV